MAFSDPRKIHHGKGRTGEVGIVSQKNPEGWISESMRFHGSNVVSSELISGNQRMSLISKYLPQSTLDSLPDLEEALNRFQVRESVVLGDLNTDISCFKNPRDR